MDPKRLQASARKAAALLKAMANERRLTILCHLAGGERSVGALEAVLDLSQSALSQHLARLRTDRLVLTRRDGQTIYYRLAGSDATAILAALHSIFCAPGKSENRRRPA
ncbi:MAG: helix-turn-helix transcriptional regulator [Rhodospirillales bacterium]|nr:helix-turn-helix transcriptional regulator [Rhodospirillales bacterium]